HLPHGDAVDPVPIENRHLLRVDDDGRERFLDDRRAGDAVADAQVRAVVDRGRDEALAEEGLAPALDRRAAAATADARQRRLLRYADERQAQTAQDRLFVARGIGVQLLVQGVEALDRVLEIARPQPAGGGDRHR